MEKFGGDFWKRFARGSWKTFEAGFKGVFPKDTRGFSGDFFTGLGPISGGVSPNLFFWETVFGDTPKSFFKWRTIAFVRGL